MARGGGRVTVAALYVDPAGVYAGLPDVEVWDEARDARLYAGPWPVVAHPPCQRWCQLAPLNESLHAEKFGSTYRVGADGGTFAAALEAVRRWGGVLEHPALSLAWPAFNLPRPGIGGWTTTFEDPGWVTEVSQVAYGHEARKRTWLYAVGCDLPALNWGEPPATRQVSKFGLNRRSARSIALVENGLDKNKSNYTPPEFRDVLLDMARSVQARSAA